MKFAYPEIQRVFETEEDSIHCIVIENQELLYRICTDVFQQINGFEGDVIVSIKDKPVDLNKNVELLTQFVPFDINRRTLLSKLTASAEKIAVSPEMHEKTMMEMAHFENYLLNIINELPGNVEFAKFTVSSLLKATGLQFEEEYTSLGEKLIDYMELTRTYDRDKLFVLVNLRSYIADRECELFLETVKRKMLHVIMIDNIEHTLLARENRYIIDQDLCEIS